ncbi:AAA family ATPase [Aestuariibacter sp. AA17]|uniref:AAA family ATPase n=1 Tax=Fluctibacter corallii TaxID=2984329 RepID=A0ABT3AEJ2_9ALTE|nr:AAA family ATPase [Aestuariibacter sp. AA17]MCV2886651.1 AAA family ATPase [Aestuariibacter sp. AA17]
MHTLAKATIDEISNVLIGKHEQIKLALTCILANGHLLIEDLPGMGKTSLCHALAHVLGLQFSRIQFTSDLLPGDMLGVSIFDTDAQQFRFHAGPIFSQLVLADELNRASPKTQSALLEAMEEKQVSIDGETRALPSPFFVIGTQNPIYQSGTFPLPESQLDRFLMRIELGYPNREAEKAMLKQEQAALSDLQIVMDVSQVQALQRQVAEVHASDHLIDYILRLITYSRETARFPHPLSPRASKALLVATKAWALIEGRDHALPEDVQAVLPAVTEHRLRSELTQENAGTRYSELLLQAVDPVLSA